MRVLSDEEIDVFQRLPAQSRDTHQIRGHRHVGRSLSDGGHVGRLLSDGRQDLYSSAQQPVTPQRAARKVSLTSFLPRLLESLHASLVCASTGHSRGQRQRGLKIQGYASSNTGRRTILVRKSQTMSSRIAMDSGSGVRASPNPYIIIATVHAGSKVVGGESGALQFTCVSSAMHQRAAARSGTAPCRALPSKTSTSQSPLTVILKGPSDLALHLPNKPALPLRSTAPLRRRQRVRPCLPLRHCRDRPTGWWRGWTA